VEQIRLGEEGRAAVGVELGPDREVAVLGPGEEAVDRLAAHGEEVGTTDDPGLSRDGDDGDLIVARRGKEESAGLDAQVAQAPVGANVVGDNPDRLVREDKVVGHHHGDRPS
jgi:hypothetical protein